jgi:PHD/YefM family antitoxin component YafN of YafNO toxin-antitoxin module
MNLTPQDILPLTDFKRNTPEVRERLRESGRPAVLTVDGRAELVVQDADAYQKLLDRIEELETIDAVREGVTAARDGRVREFGQFDAAFSTKHKIPE